MVRQVNFSPIPLSLFCLRREKRSAVPASRRLREGGEAKPEKVRKGIVKLCSAADFALHSFFMSKRIWRFQNEAIYMVFSSFRHFGQTFLPLKTVMSLVPSQKMQLGLYFFRMTDEPST